MLSYFHHLLLQQRPEWFDILVPATMVILPSTQLPNEKSAQWKETKHCALAVRL